MGPRVVLALILGATLLGCNHVEEATAAPGSSPKMAEGAKGNAPQAAPELTPPPGAPSADQVVGSKAGGG